MSEVIVIDNGTCLTKAGLSSEDAPRSQFPSIVGKPKLPSVMVGMDHRDSFIGHQAQQQHNVLFLKNPIKHGFVQNWEDMQQILHHIYYSQLRVTPEEHPCLIAQSPQNPHASRHKLTEIIFQSLNVPQFYLANQSVLSLFATGRTTGLVVDSGAGVTSSVPIYEGYAIPHAIKRNNFAGNDLDHFLIEKILKQKGVRLNYHGDFKTLVDIKSRMIVAKSKKNYQNSKFENKNPNKHQQQNGFSLPDGNWLDISNISSECAEIIFDPQSFSFSNVKSIQSLVKTTIDQCDKDIRQDLFHNIVTSGGSSNLQNFSGRLNQQLKDFYPSESIKIHQKSQREFLPWLGGSMLSSLPTFQNMWVSKQQYLQNGVSIIDKKCF